MIEAATATAPGVPGRASAFAPERATDALTAVAIVAGCLALAWRPVSWASIAVLAAVGAAALFTPVGARGGVVASRSAWVGVTALGVAAFSVARVRLGDTFPSAVGLPAVFGGALAALAEEAFFRRLVFGWVERFGAVLAVAVSALTFAVVHIPAWGTRSLPVDLAAGALLGWQRWASGSWTAPAATHAAANLLMIL